MPGLTTTNHRRDLAGLTYVYPVLSRRAGGLSIGINLNTNNACNWRCIYCQVPGLVRGEAPEINLELLQRELREFIAGFKEGPNYEHYGIPPGQRVIRDIAISGNGEPTSAPEFDRVMDVIGICVRDMELPAATKLVLITNGSLIHRPAVQDGLRLLQRFGGEAWFKLDGVTNAGMRRINNANISMRTVRKNLATCAALCTTWIQTCVFALDGEPLSAGEREHYLDFLATILTEGVQLKGVYLYGIARPSLQPEAARLSRLPQEWLEQFASHINKQTGLAVTISV